MAVLVMIDVDTNTFTNAPGNATSDNDVTITFRVSTTYARILLADDSYSNGEFEQDLAVAKGTSGDTSFADMTGYASSGQYSRSGSTYTYGAKESAIVDGEGYPDTVRDDIYWNGTKVYEAGFVPGTSWNIGNSVEGDSDGYTYTILLQQETVGSDTYYSVMQSDPALTAYVNNTGVTITHMKVVWSGTVSDAGSQTTPLRTLNGSPFTTSSDTGWVAVSSVTDIDFVVQQVVSISNGSPGGASHNTDGKLEFWVRASGYNDTKIKEIGVNINTFAESS